MPIPFTRSIAVVALLLAFVMPGIARADEAGCNEDIGRYTTSLLESHGSQLSRCIRFRNYDDCARVEGHVKDAQTDLVRRLTSENRDCYEAVVVEAVPLARFGPPTCPAAGLDCDFDVPSLDTVGDLADCLNCIGLALADDYRAMLGLPTDANFARFEQKCIKSIVNATTKAARFAKRSIEQCAAGGTKPFDCPVDLGDQKIARKFASIAKRAAMCRDADGTRGAVSGASAGLCGGVASTDELATCMEGIALCQACTSVNRIYEQNQDCSALAGITCPNQ